MRTQFLLQTEPGKRLHAEGQKRFADVETREFLAFEDNDTTPRFAEQRCRGTTGGAAADDRHIIVFHPQKLADFATKQTRQGRLTRFARAGPGTRARLGEAPRPLVTPALPY